MWSSWCIFNILVEREHLDFSSSVPYSMCSEAHVSWRWNWYLTSPSVALSCVVAAPCQHRWILGSLHYELNDIPTLPRDFPGRICGKQCIHIGHSIISNSSPSYLLSLVVHMKIICASNHLAVIHVSMLAFWTMLVSGIIECGCQGLC